jgi:hypothetical protein
MAAVALLVCTFVLTTQTVTQPPAPTSSAAPSTTPSTTTQTPIDPAVSIDDLPVSVGRIQRALDGPPPIQLKEQHPVFRLEIFGRKPTIEDVLGEKFWIGPSPYAGMTHQEFLEMVTPKLAQPYAGFTGKYLVAETALTLMEEWALKSAIRHFRDAKGEREREQARKEVLDALGALERARHAAGVDDK